ncbi:hypothetical protein WA026_004416 [Henosepilachna vigintioctopunctata]|uniref:RNA-directed DNA polymerase n=1 Tax=Henosepilachna vigintioctopunctata TaxID=420089 RepID=A0AAW1V7Z2_9CUCU
MGIVKSKSMARSYFWWPGLDKNIENLCTSCTNCLMNKKNPEKALLRPWPIPNGNWDRLHLDFMGPFMNKYFLIVIDAYSKWLEIFPLNSITSKITIEMLRSLLARFGLPRQVVTDNGATFTSTEFQQFLSKNNIKHITSPPFHPSSNGAAENSVKTVKNALKNAISNAKFANLNLVLNNFLFDYRTTPHSTLEMSPAEVMFQRKLRTRFDCLLPSSLDKNNFSDKLRKHILTKQNKQKWYYKGTRNLDLVVGESVTVRDYRTSNKSKWIKGIIERKIGRNIYSVKIPELNNIIWKRHLNQIKKFHFNHSVIPDKVLENEITDVIDNNAVTSIPIGETNNWRPKRTVKPIERLGYK